VVQVAQSVRCLCMSGQKVLNYTTFDLDIYHAGLFLGLSRSTSIRSRLWIMVQGHKYETVAKVMGKALSEGLTCGRCGCKIRKVSQKRRVLYLDTGECGLALLNNEL